MQTNRPSPAKFYIAGIIILATVGWLAYSGARDTKSYYVTITELQAMGNKAYSKNLRVAGNVAPGTITRFGPNAQFTLLEQGKTLRVDYQAPNPHRHLQGRRPGPRHRHLRPRRHLPRHPAPGQMRQQVRPRRTQRQAHRQHSRAHDSTVLNFLWLHSNGGNVSTLGVG